MLAPRHHFFNFKSNIKQTLTHELTTVITTHVISWLTLNKNTCIIF